MPRRRDSQIPKVDRDEVIEKIMRPWKTVQVAVSDLPQEVQAQYEDPLNATVVAHVRQPKDRARTALPYGAHLTHPRGDAAQLWWAFNSTKTPEAFEQSLKERGLIHRHIARSSAERYELRDYSEIHRGDDHHRQLHYEDWNHNQWTVQTSGGWFVQTCVEGPNSTTPCQQTQTLAGKSFVIGENDSITGDLRYLDWSNTQRTASRIQAA